MKKATPILQPPEALDRWIPFRLVKNGSSPLCEWLYTGEKAFTEPFFDQTIAACRFAAAHNRRYKSVASLEMMAQWAESVNALPPAAIIFHVSRCGSTLLSQLLGEDKRNLVLSEVPFFDELLRRPLQQEEVTAEAAADNVRSALAFYGRPRHHGQQHLLIKTDSWHLHFYEHYRRLFPCIPFFLLFRHPFEVVRSQQKQRGLHSVPGLLEPELLGLGKQDSTTNLDHYMAGVLASYFRKMIHITQNDPLAFPLNYNTGMHTIIRQVYAQLQRPLENDIEQRFAERCRFHAKHPGQLFTGEEQHSSTPVYLEEALEGYRQLDTISAARPAGQ